MKRLAKAMTFSTLIGAAFMTSSCAMIQKLSCNTNNAKYQGAGDAEAGRTEQPGRNGGASCEGDYSPAQFQKDYLAGYEEKKNQMCQAGEIAKVAQKDGEAGANPADTLKNYTTCSSLPTYRSLVTTYNRVYTENLCSTVRAQKLAEKHGAEMNGGQFATHFVTCTANSLALKNAYDGAYTLAFQTAQKKKQEEFVRTTGTTNFVVATKPYTASCQVASDQSHVKVTVNNPNSEKALIQGAWNYQYYDQSFNKMADDSGVEAVLLTPQSSKSFMKMTLPKNATFCRAEFAGITQ